MSADFYTQALDPARSVIVEACAGSGKTWLIAARMLRLLLEGVAPAELLAITFTNKAAREMEERLVSWCALLAHCDAATAEAFLRDRAVPRERLPELLPIARTLHAKLLTAQPGVNVRTYHSWFGDLIARAPLFSPLAHDSTLDDSGNELRDEAWRRAGARWVHWAPEPDEDAVQHPPQALAFRELCALGGVHKAERLVNAFLAKRVEWQAFTEHCASADEALAFALEKLADDLNIDPNEAPYDVLYEDTALLADLRTYIELVHGRTPTMSAAVEALGEAVLQIEERRPHDAWWPRVRLTFLTQKAEARAFQRSAKQNKARGEEREAAAEFLHHQLADRMLAMDAMIAAHGQWELNRLTFSVGQDLLHEWQQLKAARNVHDFADLEWRAWQLVAHDDTAAYVQAKLDARYRHLLLDEFQDTNPLQWKILQSWLSAYGTDTTRPTVFLVGDPKQAIYRFRRADARVFDAARVLLEADFQAVTLKQQQTRRNAPAVVDAVNQVFIQLSDTGEFIHFTPHTTSRITKGEVIAMPLATPDPQSAIPDPAQANGLRNSLETTAPEAPASLHGDEAESVADYIKALVGQRTIEDPQTGAPRAAQYRDVLVLARARTHVHHLEAALAARDIPVISARRGGLVGTLEAQDLQALLTFLSAPFNNLALAHALKSPLLGATDEDLIALAKAARVNVERGASDWWPCLQSLTLASPALQRARRLLSEWLALTGLMPTHDLLDRIYHQTDAINSYRASVPPWRAAQVQANLEAFIGLSLEVESGRYASVPRFIERLKRYAADTSENQEAPDEGEDTRDNAVRVMTIHAAKGLEAPIVLLLGANSQRKRPDYADVLIQWKPEDPRPERFLVFDTKPKTGGAAKWFEEEEVLAERENLNLLYVAMTRARDVLVVSGVEEKQSARMSWYGRVAGVVSSAAESEVALLPSTSGKGHPSSASPSGRGGPGVASPEGKVRLSVGARTVDLATPATRLGEALHLALDIASKAAPRELLQASPLGLTDAEITTAWQHAQRLIATPALAHFFHPAHPSAHNELELVVQGQLLRIDRVVETADALWVLDYKLRLTHESESAYVAQLRKYATAIAQLYPQKQVRAALVDCTAFTYQEIAVV